MNKHEQEKHEQEKKTQAQAAQGSSNPTEASEDARARAQRAQEDASKAGQSDQDARKAAATANRHVSAAQPSQRMRELESMARRTAAGRGDAGGGTPTIQEIPPLPEQQQGKPEPIVPRTLANPPFLPENNPNPYPDAAGTSGSTVKTDPKDPRVQVDTLTGAKTITSPDAQRKVSGGHMPASTGLASDTILREGPAAHAGSGAPAPAKPSGNP